MSEVAAAARLSLGVADFASIDESGKLNIIGGNVGFLGFDPMQGLTTRFTVWAHIALPHHILPAELSIELALLDDRGRVFEIGGPLGSQAVRMAQPITIDKSSAPVIPALREHMGSSHQMVVDFGSGLPLQPNGTYVWRLQIDGDEDFELRYPLGVAGPPPGPVIG